MQKLPTIEQLDTDLAPVLRTMEVRGILIDVPYLQKLAVTLSEKLTELEQQIHRAAGHEFLIDSPRQLATVIYDELHLDEGSTRIRKTKTHQSTAASELEKFVDANPIVPLILEYREKKKLLSTYVEPLPTLVGEDGRLHTTYGVDTASGRLSSKHPNLQNIPTRTDEGRAIRKAFVAKPGYELLSIDYSQIELRIAAHFSSDPGLIKAFTESNDIHSATAKTMGVDRRVAKAINFGLLFGQGAYGLGESLQISQAEAKAFIDQYFTNFPKLKEWMESVQELAREKGYAETLLGRKRFLGELKSHNGALRSFAERVAINHPVQGTEAEIVAMAMIELHKVLKEADASMLLQVHDELMFEIPTPIKKETINAISEVMETVIELKVPIVTEAKHGTNWGEMTVLKQEESNKK